MVLTLMAFSSHSFADDSTNVSCSEIIRGQLQSIAREVVARVNFDPKVRVTLKVEGDGPKTLAENTFIEVLQEQHYSSILHPQSSEGQTLSIYLLGINISVEELDAKLFKQRCQTNLEARTIIGAEHETRFIGTFHREALDTVHVYPSIQFLFQPEEDATNLMQRILTPFILIAGAVLVIYLFFTVRS